MEKKPKILFWLNADFSNFAIAYFLQKKINADFYAIIDVTKKPKKFFEQQKIVKFEKVWYFHDHIDPSYNVTDMEFLSNFEKKYDLDLWKNIINERIFYNFFDYYKFSKSELLSISEQSGKLFEKILDDVKPDLLLAQAPVLFHSELFYELAMKKNVRCLLLSLPKIAGKCMVSQQVTKIDNIDNLVNMQVTKNRTDEEISSYLYKKSADKIINEYVKSNFNSYNSLFNTFLKYLLTPNSNSNSNYTYYGRTKFNVITKTIGLFFKKKLRENFMKDNLSFKTANLEPFVYFPLSVDMERNLLINTPFYTNQIETIRIIAKSLPINYRLIVKENPGQELREWRSSSYYKKILMIPNVTLIHPSIRGRDLVKNASLVISSTGSSALEASFFRTPSIILGDVFYSFLPSVHKITKLEDFPSLIKTALKTKIEMSDLNRFIDITEKTFVEFPAFEFEAEFNSRFYHGLFDVEINEDDLLDFLNKNENIFQDLINTHIEKIQQYYKQKR